MTLRNLFLYKKLISSENKDHCIEVCFSFSCSSIKEIQYVIFLTLDIFKHSSALRSFIQLCYNRKNDYITLFTVCKYDYEISTAVRYKNSVNTQKPNVT